MKPKSHYRDMNFEKAEKVRHLYWHQGLRQQRIADLMGMTQASVSRIVSKQVWDHGR